VHKQIELATCGLLLIIEKLLKFVFAVKNDISCHLYASQSVVCEMTTEQEGALYLGWLFETKSIT
jgi:hypothetical protein